MRTFAAAGAAHPPTDPWAVRGETISRLTGSERETRSAKAGGVDGSRAVGPPEQGHLLVPEARPNLLDVLDRVVRRVLRQVRIACQGGSAPLDAARIVDVAECRCRVHLAVEAAVQRVRAAGAPLVYHHDVVRRANRSRPAVGRPGECRAALPRTAGKEEQSLPGAAAVRANHHEANVYAAPGGGRAVLEHRQPPALRGPAFGPVGAGTKLEVR